MNIMEESFRTVDFGDGQNEMAGVYAAGADHRALSAKLAGLQKAESLVRTGIVKFLDGGTKACPDELPGGADGGAASAGHALAHIRLKSGQLFELSPVEKVKIYSGTWSQTETEIYHLSRTKVL